MYLGKYSYFLLLFLEYVEPPRYIWNIVESGAKYQNFNSTVGCTMNGLHLLEPYFSFMMTVGSN